MDVLWDTKSKGDWLIVREISSKISNLCDPNPRMLQMDIRKDDMHRALKRVSFFLRHGVICTVNESNTGTSK